MDTRLWTVLGVLLADARRHRLVTATTLLGVAIGVAVIVAIRLSSAAALENFRATHGSLAGEATHAVTGIGPLPPERLRALAASPVVEAVQPVVESMVVVPAPEPDGLPTTLRVLGVDPFLSGPFLPWQRASRKHDGPSGADAARELGELFERIMLEPGLAILSQDDLAGLRLPGGGPLTVRGPRGEHEIHVVPLPKSVGEELASGVALMDLASAQEALGLGGDILRYDLVLRRDASGRITPETEAAVPLEPGEFLDRAARRGERADLITHAFRTNLMALGFLAVLVGAYLVFNMAQFAVTRRRALLGKLRCLGCPARTVRHATLVEGAVLGFGGGLLGVAGGRMLATAMVGDVARTVRTLYGYIPPPEIALDAVTTVGALAVAVGSAVAATWLPARSAAATPPALVATGAFRESPVGLRVPAVLLVAAVAVLFLPGGGIPLAAVAVVLLLLAVATWIPTLLGAVTARHPQAVVLALAAGRIQRSLARTGGAAGALVMPLAMTIAIAVMVGSFEREVRRWVSGSLAADVYVSPLWAQMFPQTARMESGLLERLESLPEVTDLDVLRTLEQRFGNHAFLASGARLHILKGGGLRLLAGSADGLIERIEGGDTAISEPLATRTGLGPGDSLTLSTRDGPVDVEVAAVFQDFGYDRGVALLHESRYLSLFGETGIQHAALTLAPGTDAAALADGLAREFTDSVFTPTESLRGEVMSAFDNTFAITYVLQAISTALAWVGVLTGLLCLHLERRHELGVLRALGAASRRVFGLLMTEAMIIVAVAGVVAIPTGAALAWILIEVVNRRSFGWSFPMAFEAGAVATVLLSSLAAGLLAGLVPWWMVRRTHVADLLEVRS